MARGGGSSSNQQQAGGASAAKAAANEHKSGLKRPIAAKKAKHAAEAENQVHRRFKFHEKKMLRKVDFMQYEDDDWHESYCIPKYNLTDREDYRRYLRLVGLMKSEMSALRVLPPSSKIRIEVTDQMLKKLYDMGLIQERLGLSEIDKLGVENFCKRRLSAVLVKQRMAGNHKLASDMIEHGHVRVGVTQVRDPAFLVPRALEPFVTWVDSSKIKKHVENFSAQGDDYS